MLEDSADAWAGAGLLVELTFEGSVGQGGRLVAATSWAGPEACGAAEGKLEAVCEGCAAECVFGRCSDIAAGSNGNVLCAKRHRVCSATESRVGHSGLKKTEFVPGFYMD
eukprot:485000-Rhodomonas_salina.3